MLRIKPTRLFNREAQFLAQNSGQDCPSVFLITASYSSAHLGRGGGVYFTRPLVRTHNRKQLTAIIAHELGHKAEPLRPHWRYSGRALVERARIVRGICLGGLMGAMVISPSVAFVPYIAACAALPYVMNVGLHQLMRHFEFKADRYAATLLGTPVPVAQFIRKSELRPVYSKVSQSFSVQTHLALLSNRVSEAIRKPGIAFFRLANYSGPLTQTHPTPRQRRIALLKLPRNRAQIEALKQACVNPRPRSRSSQHTAS